MDARATFREVARAGNSSARVMQCVHCNHSWNLGDPKAVPGTVKKRAKAGHPWAQYYLGSLYTGHYKTKFRMPQSNADARRWYRKASKQGHPLASLWLGLHLSLEAKTRGCAPNPAEARFFIEKAMHLDCNLGAPCRLLLICIATDPFDGKNITVGAPTGNTSISPEEIETAKEIIEPMAREALAKNNDKEDAQYQLARVFMAEGDYVSALELCSSAFFSRIEDGDKGSDCSHAPYSAMLLTNNLGSRAQTKFWFRIAKQLLPGSLDIHERGDRVRAFVKRQRMFRELRDTCGGCGVEFEGKERKFCRGCRAVCYCSRDCQKMHWNRKNDGHREDCKAATELKRKLKEARKKAATGVATEAAYSL